jgi:hypothetical protein
MSRKTIEFSRDYHLGTGIFGSIDISGGARLLNLLFLFYKKRFNGSYTRTNAQYT